MSKVDITVGKPLKWTTAVQATGKGWGQLLDALINLRISDGVPPNVYYYGMCAPSISFEQFCGNGCVLGLSPASTDPNDEYQRGSIGVGYLDSYAESDVTFVHEVGHAHGRQHAPCGGAAQPDPKYPYSDGSIGDWGFDSDQHDAARSRLPVARHDGLLQPGLDQRLQLQRAVHPHHLPRTECATRAR